jgi:hypothetical protein
MCETPFSYREFWDVPRMLICNVGGETLLLDSRFDAASDEYKSGYDIYILRGDADYDALADWSGLPADAIGPIGSIQASAIEFDATKRNSLNAEPLTQILRKHNR